MRQFRRPLAALLFIAMVLAPGALFSQEGSPTQAKPNPALLDPKLASATAPESFNVKLETTKGDITIEVVRMWAPNGADRFYNLVKSGFYNDVAFFRVIDGFMAQVGLNGDPEVTAAWTRAPITDDPVKKSNIRAMVTFAMTGNPNSRTTQFFINYGNNSYLDQSGFAPFGEVVDGMSVADSLFSAYGEGAPRGRGPSQGQVTREGNAYLEADFPMLDYIKKATVIEG